MTLNDSFMLEQEKKCLGLEESGLSPYFQAANFYIHMSS